MKWFKIVMFALFLTGCATLSEKHAEVTLPANISDGGGIENAKEFSGRVESWGKTSPLSSTLSTWIQEIRGGNYVLVQIRANLDTYRFALAHDQVVSFIDALDVYQMNVRQSKREQTSAIGWLYRANVKLKRMGEDAKDDRFIVNIKRTANHAPSLSLTFDSWLLSFGGPDSPANRVYKSVEFSPEEASRLRNEMSKYVEQM